jgi:hypothetical protein
MKMNYRNKKWVCAVIGALLVIFFPVVLSSCDKEEEVEEEEVVEEDFPEGGIFPIDMNFFVRFVSPSGTNVLDSLNVLEGSDMVKIKDSLIIDASAYRASNGKDYDCFTNMFIRDNNDYFNYGTDETFFYESFTEFTRPKIDWSGAADYCVLQMKSNKLFGNDNVHTIKLYYTMLVDSVFTAYKCEVDGEVYPMWDDPLYQSSLDKFCFFATMITIYLK